MTLHECRDRAYALVTALNRSLDIEPVHTLCVLLIAAAHAERRLRAANLATREHFHGTPEMADGEKLLANEERMIEIAREFADAELKAGTA